MINILYIHGMGGGGDSRIPSILNSALYSEEINVIVRTYDFDPETIKEGIYKVTFSTTGRELKVHTTDHVEEGQEVGLTFYPEDIHVMEKMVF